MSRSPKAARPKGPEPTLVAAGVSKSVDDLPLLAPVSVSVAPGQCLVLRGENGSGKTTLMRLLSGTTEPTTGTVTLQGRTVDERDPTCRRALASLVGAPTSYRDLTLVDHLVLVDATWGRGDGADERALALLASLEIDHLDDRFPHELSSGQQQLFHLALVLGRPSEVLLLDEPEQRLDTHKRALLGHLLVGRKQQGTSLVVACHDPELTEAIADRVVDIEPA
ncbi:ATP-binding cassette domain-containing protein [Dermatophilaceae bacterium Soc4.6]